MNNLHKKVDMNDFFTSSAWFTNMQVAVKEFTYFWSDSCEVHGRIIVELDQEYRDSDISEYIDSRLQALTCEIDFEAKYIVNGEDIYIDEFEISEFPHFKLLSPKIDHNITDAKALDFFRRHINLNNDNDAVNVIYDYIEDQLKATINVTAVVCTDIHQIDITCTPPCDDGEE